MKALILVDIQNDFCPGGKLAVTDGDKILPLVNNLINSNQYDFIVATKDWHPENHSSFKINSKDGSWPVHCVQNSSGAEFHKDLDTKKIDKTFTKGSDTKIDSYSGFYDNDKISSTGMGEWLKNQGVSEVDVVGLALDYCVKATAEDAHKLGFKTTVIKEATRAVNISPEDGESAVNVLRDQGIEVK